MLYKVLGYVGVAIFAVLVCPYILRTVNKKFLGNNKQVLKAVRFLKKIHKPAGIVLLLVSLCHAYIITGGFRYLNTGGLILYAVMLLCIICAVIFGITKKKLWLTLHKAGVVVTLVFLANHILFKLF